jgi:CCDC81 eukaryotic HU domain 2
MIYCNPVPIASACLLGGDVVKDVLSTIFLAIIDLVKYSKDLDLAFGFCNIRVVGKSLKAYFNSSFSESVTDKLFENKMQRSVTPVSTIWKTSHTQKFAMSTMGTLIMKPNHDVVQTLNDKTKALKLMSLDLSSSGKF